MKETGKMAWEMICNYNTEAKMAGNGLNKLIGKHWQKQDKYH